MNCIKCGRSISGGGVFCSACSAPPAPMTPVQMPVKKASPAKKTSQKQKKKGRTHYIKLSRALTAAVAVLSVMLLLLSAALFYGTRLYLKRQHDLRVREASVTLREKELDNLENRVTQLEEELAKAKWELDKIHNE